VNCACAVLELLTETGLFSVGEGALASATWEVSDLYLLSSRLCEVLTQVSGICESILIVKFYTEE
jgi:hypothetical protein